MYTLTVYGSAIIFGSPLLDMKIKMYVIELLTIFARENETISEIII